MAPIKSTLQDMFPGQALLSPADVARCLKLATPHIFHLLLADPLPLALHVRGAGRLVFVDLDDLADFFDEPIAGACVQVKTDAGQGQVALLMTEALFKAELRAEVYQSKLFVVMDEVIDLIEKFQVEPQSVDERCLAALEFSKVLLEAEAKHLLTQLVDFIVNTTPKADGKGSAIGREEAAEEI